MRLCVKSERSGKRPCLWVGLALLLMLTAPAQGSGMRTGEASDRRTVNRTVAAELSEQDDPHDSNESGSVMSRIYQALSGVENWLLVGVVLLVGRLGGKLGARLRTPSIVGYLVVGIVLGCSALNVISVSVAEKLEPIADFGLGIVAFMIGTELSRKLIRGLGSKLIVIMVSESITTFLVVTLLMWAISGWVFPIAGLAVAGALIFGAMAPASAPAGTVAVIQEYKAKGPMTSLLLGIVGLDDAFAIMVYVFAAAAAKTILRPSDISLLSLLEGPCVEILGAMLVGAIVGIALLLLLRRQGDRGDTLTYALGAILITTGLANTLGFSLILANLTVGTVLVNLSPRNGERAYGSLEQISTPIYVLFFVLAGARLDLRLLAAMTMLGPLYVLGRSAGKIGGAYLGARLSKTDPITRRYLGLGLLSQAGVAVGLALTVANEFGAPEYGDIGKSLATLTITTVAATTIIFEIIGPITTKIALSKAGEIPQPGLPRGETS